jgi:PIN domain nuclease of toxin-antitoxin system
VSQFLLDSQIVVWAAAFVERLDETVAQILRDRRNTLLVSSATIAELAIKIANGKLTLPASPLRLCHLLGTVELPISWQHAARLETLPLLHRDPFDRLLICQAMEEEVTLITSDRAIAAYPEVSVLFNSA